MSNILFKDIYNVYFDINQNLSALICITLYTYLIDFFVYNCKLVIVYICILYFLNENQSLIKVI